MSSVGQQVANTPQRKFVSGEKIWLADFQVSHQESGLLTLQLAASQGGEKLEITFASDHEDAVLKGMEQMTPYRRAAKPTIKKR